MTLLRKIRLRLSLRAWSLLVPLLAVRRGLEPLLALARVGPGKPYAGITPAYIVRRVKRTTRRPWLMRDRPCLRQGLLAMRFLQLAGYRPVLHFAVDRTSVTRSVLSAHCWITLDDKVLLNPATPTMVEILSYADGRLVPSVPQSIPMPLA
jgi:hypothetical protein